MTLLRTAPVLLALVFAAACKSDDRRVHRDSDELVYDAKSARWAAESSWGPGFDAGRYDLHRELSSKEAKLLEKDLEKEAGRPVKLSGKYFVAHGLAPESLVEEIQKLRPGHALAFRASTESGTGGTRVIGAEPMGTTKYVVVSRDKDDKLHEERFEAATFDEALRRHRRS